MSKRSKNHHYVPKVLQRSFLAEPNHIWFSKRELGGEYCAPYLKHIDKAFYSRNYYTIVHNDELSDTIEREHYGVIDNYLGEVVPEFISALERGAAPVFSGIPLDSIKEVVLEMAKRTPEFPRPHNDLEIGKELIERTLVELGKKKDLSEYVKTSSVLGDSSKLIELGRSIRVRATISRSDRVAAALSELSVRWATIPSKHAYILSSLMVYRVGNGGSNALNDPKTELWMPISPRFALVVLHDPGSKIPLIVRDSPRHVRKINEYAARNSSEIGSHSRKLIESITGKRARV
ncbi:DUF4238 domain-containing protein [Vannielia litorea]|uniref:DUF4238 domain-containing protein n=1 Tax=Vannielia litorea TaxID=1217970 RepID=A0A1N6G8A1_9RHOB|nr:DUF4238 domain-containing protein [Vannielia litorea]SIO03642.1 Protein of unknown function [Vannielia litorea]